MKVLIIAVGNELLNGKVHDYNSYWIAKRLTNLGYEVVRIFTIPDELGAIIESLEWGKYNGVSLIITTGGLGPTPGDLTLEAVAKFANRKIVLDERAVSFVKKRYSELYNLGFVDTPGLNDYRLKMAKVPEGSTLIYNDVGVAPGVLLETGNLTILSMPGVPSEMMYILEKAIPLLPKPSRKNIYLQEAKVNIGDESILAGIFEELMKKFPKLRIKSYPEGFGETVSMRIIMEYQNGDREEAEKVFSEALRFLKSRIG